VLAGITQRHDACTFGLWVFMSREVADELEALGPRVVFNFNRGDGSENQTQRFQFELEFAVAAAV